MITIYPIGYRYLPPCAGRQRHRWARNKSLGCRENPGVVSKGGTVTVVCDVCQHCGLSRTTKTLGSQRQHGQHDTTTYRLPDCAALFLSLNSSLDK